MAQFDLKKSARLLKSAEFDRVFQRRCSFVDRLIVVYFARRQPAGTDPANGNRAACHGDRVPDLPGQGTSEYSRLGLVVSRKCGNAVVRNRWKRALREAFRLVRPQLPRHLDLVALPRRGVQPDVACLQESFKQLAARAADKLALDDSRERRP